MTTLYILIGGPAHDNGTPMGETSTAETDEKTKE